MSYELAREAYRNGDLREAVRLAEVEAHGGGRPESRVSALTLVGIAHRELGYTREAIDRLERADESLASLDSMRPVMAGVVQYNLALSLWQDERLEEAVTHFRQAVNLFREEQLNDHLRQALQNLAWVLAESGDFAEANRALVKASPLCTTVEQKLRQRIATAYVRLLDGDAGASKSLENAMHDDSLTPVINAELGAIMSALCARGALLAGKVESARTYLTAAHQLAATQRDARVFRVVLAAEEALRLNKPVRP